MRIAQTIALNEVTERRLRVLAKSRTVQARLQQRALVVPLVAEGRRNKAIAVEMGLDRRQVALWRQRFLAGGIDALRKDAPRSGQRASRTNYIHPEPFIWTASARDILAEVTRAGAALAATAGQVQNRVAHCTSLRIRQARCEGSHTRLGGPAGRLLHRHPRHVARSGGNALCLVALAGLWLASISAQAQTTAPAMARSASMPMGQMHKRTAAPHDMKAAMTMGMDGMQKMPMSGDIDKDFAMMMKLHHQQAVNMAEMELAQGKSSEMKAMAKQIIAAQKREIAQFDRWLVKQK